MSEIQLTPEQKECAEYSLDKKILVISADPGTGKTEVLKQRTLFIHQQNQQQRKLILVLAYGRNIAIEIRTKLKAEKIKVFDRLKNLWPVLSAHQHICSLNEFPTSWENRQPLVLVCTIHSLAYGINDLVIKQQFQEKRKTKMLVATQTVEEKHGVVLVENQDQKFTWKSRGAIKSRKKRLFNYLLSSVAEKYLGKTKRKILWGIFSQSEPENVVLTKIDNPYLHYEIDYSRFLAQVQFFVPDEQELLTELAESCQHDQTKNIWLDFEDIIENANNLKNQKRIWPEFDYILVDECQDLKKTTFNLITDIFGSNQTNFTFVGDPKQNIMGFAGATEDIFTLLEQKFPGEVHGAISTSFRLTPEIANFANHFIRKFMEKYRPAIQTTKPNSGQKPQVIMVGQELDYRLNSQEADEIETELAENLELKRANLVQKKIRMKKLEKHMTAILPTINQLDKHTSKAILYRQNWIGELLQKWLNEKGIMTNISEAIIEDILRKTRRQLKNFSLTEFPSLQSFLVSCRISENSIFQLAEIVKKIEENSLPDSSLTREKVNEFISQLEGIKNHLSITLSTIHGMKGLEADYVFLIFCDKKVLPKKEKFKSDWEEREEKNLFFTAITRPKIGLYITTSSEKECSPFIDPTNLDLDLVELIEK